MKPHDLGNLGDDAAVAYLEDRGYQILECKFRTDFGEIDIIARDGDTLCFVEVKSRETDEKGHPFEAVTPRKQAVIIRVAKAWLQNDPAGFDQNVRFDVVGLSRDEAGILKIELLQNAFDTPGG